MTDDDYSDLPVWCRPKEKAVLIQPNRIGQLKADDVTILRTTKTRVVFHNHRLKVDDYVTRLTLQRRIGGAWGNTLYLVPPDDARIALIRADLRIERAKGRAMQAHDQFRRGQITAQQVADAWQAYADILKKTRTDG